jgi:hypothetical protein
MWYIPYFWRGKCPPLQDQTNLYGLGIRIGLYLLWFAAILAHTLLHAPQYRTTLRDTTYLFNLAFFISLLVDNDRNYRSDSLVVILLMASTTTLLALLEVTDRTRPRPKRRPTGHNRRHPPHRGPEFLRIALLAAFTIYLNYWWFKGMYTMRKDCGRHVTFFAKEVQITGPFRLVGQIWSPLLVVLMIPILFQFLRWCYQKRRIAALNRQRARQGTSAGQVETSFMKRAYWASPPPPSPPPPRRGTIGSSSSSSSSSEGHRRGHRHKRSRRALVVAWALGDGVLLLILFIELMLAYSGNTDELNGVKNSGQLIPLLVGFGAVVLVLWKLLEQRRRV